MKKRIFIGSSTEALTIAYAIQENLEKYAEVTVWSQDIFRPSRYSIEELENALEVFEYGVFVFCPEDLVHIRNENFKSVRDNVLFEFGLFTGKLGRENCFFVIPHETSGFRLPTDLAGITALTYDSLRSDENINAALGPACNKIRKEIDFLTRMLWQKQELNMIY